MLHDRRSSLYWQYAWMEYKSRTMLFNEQVLFSTKMPQPHNTSTSTNELQESSAYKAKLAINKSPCTACRRSRRRCDGVAPNVFCSSCIKRGRTCIFVKNYERNATGEFRQYDPSNQSYRIDLDNNTKHVSSSPPSSSQCSSSSSRENVFPNTSQCYYPTLVLQDMNIPAIDIMEEQSWTQNGCLMQSGDVSCLTNSLGLLATDKGFDGTSFGVLPSDSENHRQTSYPYNQRANESFTFDSLFGSENVFNQLTLADGNYSRVPEENISINQFVPRNTSTHGQEAGRSYRECAQTGLDIFADKMRNSL
ncbi:hypothetical protein SCHPADRAFT_553780 [Schizopora paradoxa]|uniref:Zn(2)-C6 fungal-type domain-containing protein n=1 Tax=Schizopora paradoxa TaxID=27342 RepID=A0A0H2RY51_9AGAM|nr:hypothetical protein SCHPADRAFT_553780 [Schizopora paradoxa]